MPYKCHHGKLHHLQCHAARRWCYCIICSVTQHAIGVIADKQVPEKFLPKRSNVHIAHPEHRKS